MNLKECRFTKDHEWICPESGNTAKIGLTAYAQEQLGDIVFLDLPAPGTAVQQFKKLGEVESVKAVSEIFSPASGKVTGKNEQVAEHPEVVNQDPYGKGWLVTVEVSNPAELNTLMDRATYDKFVAGLTEEKKG
jgi:glycine cleavage system H protein